MSLLWVLLTLHFAHAADVARKALCAQPVIIENESVNRKNTRDQRPIGWCYAYAASDLVSFTLNKRVSAVALHSSNRNPFLEQLTTKDKAGGFTKKAIEFAMDLHKGFCLESEVRSSDFGFSEAKNLKDLVGQTEKLKAEVKNNPPCSLESRLSSSPLAADLKKFLPALEVAQFATQNWNELIASACKTKIKLSPQDMIKSGRGPNYIADIDNQLNDKNICGISYSLNILVDRNDMEQHASVVIGRRWNETIQQCEYLIRNSWGNSCRFKTRDDLYCDKNNDGSDNGHFWVGEDRLKKSLSGTTYIEPYFKKEIKGTSAGAKSN